MPDVFILFFSSSLKYHAVEGKESKNPPAIERCKRRVQSLGREETPEEEIATHSSILVWESQGQRSFKGYSPQGHKESDMT